MVRPVIRVPYSQDGTSAPSGVSFDPRSSSATQHRLMSKVPSLLFDMEDAEETPTTVDTLSCPDETEACRNLHDLLDPWTDQEYMLKLHVRIAADEAAKRGAEHLELADTLRRLGYPVKLRTALGGGWGGACLRNLRHSFLAVTLAPPAAITLLNSTNNNNKNTLVGGGGARSGFHTAASSPTTTVLVDPRFRDQFEIAHATPRYARILAEVPSELVLPPERLTAAVELLCGEMARAFAATGTPVPPWRQQAAMLSKWQPRRSQEVDICHGGGGGVYTADASALNNAVGGAGPFAAGDGNCTTTTTTTMTSRAQKLTGSNSIKEKLLMLGMQPATASPICEEEGIMLETDNDEEIDDDEEQDDMFSYSMHTMTEERENSASTIDDDDDDDGLDLCVSLTPQLVASKHVSANIAARAAVATAEAEHEAAAAAAGVWMERFKQAGGGGGGVFDVDGHLPMRRQTWHG